MPVRVMYLAINALGLFRWRYYALKAGLIRIPHLKGDLTVVKKIKEYNKVRPNGPKRNICYVPMNNILFSKGGKILACSYNQSYVLGYYPEEKISEILTGERRKKLIDFHSKNDLSCGCEYCLRFIESKKYSGIKPLTFDKYSHGYRLDKPRVLEFDISSRCNLNCITCNETGRGIDPVDSPYDDSFIEEITPYLKDIKEAKFYGGEPFMIPQYYKIWRRIVDVNSHAKIFVITNGTILNDEIREILNKGRFEIGVSVDSTEQQVFEKIRTGASYNKVVENISWYSDYCRRKNTSLSLSMTICRMNWRNIPDMIEFCNEHHAIIYVSYLYNPRHLSLWTLSEQEMQEIITYLTTFDFPKITFRERYNYHGYIEIIEHLKYWKEKNKDVKNEQAVVDYKLSWRNKLREYYCKNSAKGESGADALVQHTEHKLESLIAEAGYKEHLHEIYKEINNISIENLLWMLDSMTPQKVRAELDSWLKKL